MIKCILLKKYEYEFLDNLTSANKNCIWEIGAKLILFSIIESKIPREFVIFLMGYCIYHLGTKSDIILENMQKDFVI